MKLKKFLKYIFLPILLGGIGFLYGFSNQRNSQQTITKSVVKFHSKEPYFLEVCVEKEDNVFPMIPTGASVSDIRLE